VGRAISNLSDQVADEATDQIYSQLASYASVPRQDIIVSVRKNLARGIAVLIDGSVPQSVPEEAEAGDTTRTRLNQGARWEDIVRAYRFSLTAVHEAFLQEAARSALNPEATLEGSSLLWELGDWFINGSAEAFTTWSNEVAGARAAAETEFIRGLLNDDWQNPQFASLVAEFGLQPDEQYCVCIAPENTAWDEAGPVIVSATLQHRLIGVTTQAAALRAPDAPIAVGPAWPLDTLSRSAHVAESIWSVVREDPAGVYDLSTVGWRIAIPDYPQLSKYYLERYIFPLNPDTAGGQALMTTLSVFLKHNGNVRLAAQELRLHENSLRYRLERFSTKTGIELTTIDHKIGLAWAIAAYEHAATNSEIGEFYNFTIQSSEETP
jgi:putative transposase